MFIKLTHGLHTVLNAIVSYIQKWTDDSVPDGTKTLHNFKDGQGKRPAVPEDDTTSSTNIIGVKTDNKYGYDSDSVSSSENVLKVELKTELANGSDSVASKTGIESTICVPEPVIFEIHNEVPDKIERIIPVKTQALPGQDFIFQILYVKDYNYIEGDILPVFGTWGNYARLSIDGKILTVNSNADLNVRLILSPAPQDWIPEHPDPSIIQQQGDRILNTIPRDGLKADSTVEQMEIEDYLYTVGIENKATTFVNNSEFSNNKWYSVLANNNKITIPITFTEGFDENSLYWKCYDDPKSETPVTGYYPTLDYNEEFGPLPNGFRKLQYISNNSNAYIDLGVKLKKDYKVKVLMNVSDRNDSSYVGMFGARNSTDTEFYYDNHTNGAYACYSKYNYRTIGFQRGTHRYYNNGYDNNDGSIRWYYSTGTSFECRNYDGTLLRKVNAAAATNIDTEWNCYLFTVNDMGTPYQYGTRGQLYRFEMWDENDNLIMRLIPAKNLETNYCGLYDIVNNKFYYNQTPTTSFSGPEFYVWQKEMQTSDHENVLTLNDISPISDYNADVNLSEDYYKLFGVYFPEAYIDTNYLLKKDDKVEVIAKVDNNTNNSYRVLFGSKTNNSNQDSYFFYTRYSGNTYFAYNKNGGESSSSASVYDTIFKLVTNQTQATWYVDGIQKGQITRSGTGKDSTYTCWLGCCNSANSVESYNYCTIYSFKVYDVEDNLKLNLVPCIRKLDNEIGFYDTVTNTFLKRKGGNNNLQARAIAPIVKKQLVIDNITKDINIGIIKNPVYDEPFKLEEVIEDEPQNEPTDSLTYNYEITDSKIMDYFYVVSTTNQATDYVSVDAGYRTANLGNSTSFTLTYKSGYDNYDISCTPDTTAKVTVNKAHYITYNELDIPADYTPVKGLYTNNSNTYFKTGYIPKWDDKVVCYCSIIKENYPTYPCYVFGARTAVNNKSFVFYAHRGNDIYRMGYDRYCGEKDIREIINNELMKITAGYNGCEVDFAYTKTKIDTICPLYRSFDYQDYNSEITLPDNYEKLSCIMNKLDSKAYIDLGLKIKSNYKVESIIYTNSSNTKSNVVLFGSTSTTGVKIADKTTTSFTYPMQFVNDSYWKNTNQYVNNSDSNLEFKILKSGTLVLKVTQSSEKNYDYIKINKNNKEIANTYGLDGSKTITLSNLVENDIIRIYYHKDGSAHGGTDTATVQILYDNNVLNADFIVGSETNTNTLYTRYNGTNCIALKQQKVKTNNNFVYNDTAKIKMDGSKITWWNFNGELVSEMEYESSTEEPSYNTYLFGLNENGEYRHFAGNADLYVYTFKLYDENDNLIYHLVPALNKTTNEYGLYDTETGTFFTNAGEDAFEGHEIEEIHYVGDDLDYEMYVFGCNQANSRQYGYYGNMYKFTIYNGKEQPVVNLVPVKRISDGVLGFYDTIRKMFITPASGAVTEASEPIYKSNMVVSDIPADTYVTITKNNNARKNIALEEGFEDDVFHQKTDQLEYNYELNNTSIIDWFNTVKYINDAKSMCSIAGSVATYYNTPKIGNTTKFPITYNEGVDNNMIKATATNGAITEITKPMKIIYDKVPDEYITLYGLRNISTSTYFEIPYKLKTTDSIKLYVSDEKYNYSYGYYIFGADYYDYSTKSSRLLCSKYTNSNDDMSYQSGNKQVNLYGPKNEVLEIDCKSTSVDFTNGYNDYKYTLTDNTATDCTTDFHIFGAKSLYGGHQSSFYGTIYKFIVYDDNGVKINLIPVKRKVDGALGFYDTIGNAFYLPNDNGNVIEAAAPVLKGKIIISNITTDADFTVTENQQPSINLSTDDSIEHSYNFVDGSISDYWYYINLTNTTNGEITFTGMVYGNCYTCNVGNNITLPCTYKAGRSSTDFIVSEGTLTNNGLVLNNVKEDKKITIMLNDYHDPKSDTADDLNIFTNPDFSGYNQYRVVAGTDLMLTSYTYINSQVAAMSDKQIFEFNTNDIDILAFNPSNIPGSSVKSKIVATDSNMNEVVQNVTINGKQMYKHTVTLRNQIKLETGKVYIFKVRDNTDTGKLIAYAKDTGPVNLVNSNYEYTVTEDGVYFNWNEANKYIVQGNKTIYFELNGIKL